MEDLLGLLHTCCNILTVSHHEHTNVVSVRDTVSRLPGGPGKTPAVYQSANTGLISWEVGKNSQAGWYISAIRPIGGMRRIRFPILLSFISILSCMCSCGTSSAYDDYHVCYIIAVLTMTPAAWGVNSQFSFQGQLDSHIPLEGFLEGNAAPGRLV